MTTAKHWLFFFCLSQCASFLNANCVGNLCYVLNPPPLILTPAAAAAPAEPVPKVDLKNIPHGWSF